MTKVMLSKKCGRCQQLKDVSCFNKNRARPDGIDSRCRVCRHEFDKINRPKKREAENRRVLEWQRKNPEKVRERHKRWVAKNPERAKEVYARYRSKKHVKERNKKKHNEWRKNNRDHLVKTRQEWQNKNPNYSKPYAAVRRARELAAGGKYTLDDLRKLEKIQKKKCAICKCCIKIKYHADHIMPLFLGGSNDRVNIQLLCPTCNMQKGRKDPIDFMRERGFLL
jgi:hypothetical protein